MFSARRHFVVVLVMSLIAGLALIVPAEASGGPRVQPRLARALHRLDAGDSFGVFVHFRDGGLEAGQRLVAERGLEVTASFPSIDVAFATGTVATIESLRSESSITYLEADRKLHYFGDTGPWATRARVAQENVSGGPYRDGSGRILDGTGVGVAVVDSGINALHPDLSSRVVKNYKIICSTPGLVNTQTGLCFGPQLFPEVPHTDVTGGHGTHVAGIVAGDGTASNGSIKGVAPGASLYGYSTGEVISVLFAAEAFQHILTNYDTFVPRIKVVNNSWGDNAGTPYNANDTLSKLTKSLVQRGVTVTYAAGNDGGNGSADEMSSTAKDPTAGVITAANYDDANTGTRSGVLDSSSSRGRQGQPNNYPDISAPGTNITSTCVQAAQPVCNLGGVNTKWQPLYSDLSGTSMATPHVSGVAALLYQANPSLTPAQVEDVLQDTALKFTAGGPYESDPQNAGGTTSFDKGAGLVDVPAALQAIGVVGSGVGPASVQVATGDGGDFPGPGAADIVSLSESNEAAGVRYTIGVRDVDDVGATSVTLRITQNVDGKPFMTNVTVTSSSVAAATSTATPTEVTRDTTTNTVSFLVPFSNMGNPPNNAPAHNAFVSSFIGLIVDVAPGTVGADAIARPQYGEPYTVRPL